jgi:hypothetical protein
MQHLSSKTVKELKEYAKDNSVDLKGAKTKAQMLGILLDLENVSSVIKADEPTNRVPASSSDSNKEGVVISKPAENHEVKIKDISKNPEKNEKVAIYANKNMRWQGIGQIFAGYNIVTKEAADKWTTLNSVRLATPKEVAAYYGKE